MWLTSRSLFISLSRSLSVSACLYRSLPVSFSPRVSVSVCLSALSVRRPACESEESGIRASTNTDRDAEPLEATEQLALKIRMLATPTSSPATDTPQFPASLSPATAAGTSAAVEAAVAVSAARLGH